jgi:hypothetical protein
MSVLLLQNLGLYHYKISVFSLGFFSGFCNFFVEELKNNKNNFMKPRTLIFLALVISALGFVLININQSNDSTLYKLGTAVSIYALIASGFFFAFGKKENKMA